MADLESRATTTDDRAGFPIARLGAFGWLAGLAWLAMLGEWAEIGIGIAATAAMPLLFRLASAPSNGLMAVSARCVEKDLSPAALASGLSGCYKMRSSAGVQPAEDCIRG